jgi:hypothetical protein
MIGKVIGTAIIGLVLSIGSASLAKYLVSNYSTPVKYAKTYYETYGQITSRIANTAIINAQRKYDSNAAFETFLYLGTLITLIIIIHISNFEYVYRKMAYSLFFCVTVGFGLGFYFAVEVGRYDGNMLFYMKFNGLYLYNSIYIGLGIAALIFGIHLATKKPNT